MIALPCSSRHSCHMTCMQQQYGNHQTAATICGACPQRSSTCGNTQTAQRGAAAAEATEPGPGREGRACRQPQQIQDQRGCKGSLRRPVGGQVIGRCGTLCCQLQLWRSTRSELLLCNRVGRSWTDISGAGWRACRPCEDLKGVLCRAAGTTPGSHLRYLRLTLPPADWPGNDSRIFVGRPGKRVNDDSLAKAFSRYPSFAKARVRAVIAGRWRQRQSAPRAQQHILWGLTESWSAVSCFGSVTIVRWVEHCIVVSGQWLCMV